MMRLDLENIDQINLVLSKLPTKVAGSHLQYAIMVADLSDRYCHGCSNSFLCESIDD